MPAIRHPKSGIVNHKTPMKSRPFHVLQCLDKFRPHNPFIMAVIRLRRIVVTDCKCSPPMRIAARGRRQDKVKRIADVVCQCAIRHIDGTVIWIIEFFGELESGNCVIGRTAMRPEQRQVFWGYADSVPHRQQGGLELCGCRNRLRVAINVHKHLQSDAKNKGPSSGEKAVAKL